MLLQSLHWSFGFIEISPLPPSMRSKIQKKNHFGFTNASSKVHFRSTEGQTFYWSIMTADDSIKCRCANSGMTGPSGWFSKSRGLSASVSFLSSSPPPRSFTCVIFPTVFDSCSSFFAPKPHRNACYAAYIRLDTFLFTWCIIMYATIWLPMKIHCSVYFLDFCYLFFSATMVITKSFLKTSSTAV